MKTRSLGHEQEQLALLQGTLDVLILRTLVFGPQHGQGIARAIQQTSEDVLLVDHGALYPALQRLEEKKWIAAKWGTSANNRKARFYAITRAGRTQLSQQSNRWRRLATAMARVLGPDPANG
jgi:PadR family transcriptional regulator PadR